MQQSVFSGVWSYRALHNATDLDIPFDRLRFATAVLRLRDTGPGLLEGDLVGKGWGSWTDWSLRLSGEAAIDEPHQFRLSGVNEIEGEHWAYEYRGWLLPPWGDAENTCPVLAGSVIRTAARAKGDARAGVSATFYAVKRQPGHDR